MIKLNRLDLWVFPKESSYKVDIMNLNFNFPIRVFKDKVNNNSVTFLIKVFNDNTSSLNNNSMLYLLVIVDLNKLVSNI